MLDVDGIVRDWVAYLSARTKNQAAINVYVSYVRELAEKEIPPIFDLRHLALLVGYRQDVLASMIFSQDGFYRSFSIKKRSGGIREICVPSAGLLFVQRWILQHVLRKIEINDASHGFTKGRSIITNARCHLHCQYLLKMDISNFFSSIPISSIVAIFRDVGYPREISFFLARLCCYNGALPQGAATSPTLSNIAARVLDARLSAVCRERDIQYTRYADDMAFSASYIPREFISAVRDILEKEGFVVNDKKTVVYGPGRKKIITGISIGSGEMKLPRETVRAIKKQAHYILTKGLRAHQLATGQFDPLLVERLLGSLTFWVQVDPGSRTAQKLIAQVSAYRATLRAEGAAP